MSRHELPNFVRAGVTVRRTPANGGALRRRRNPRRRGIAAMLAMLYLLIFAALAIGFYSAVTMASQVAHNDEKALGAQLAAESGLSFIQYQVGKVRVPGTAKPNEWMAEVLKDLQAQQAGADNIAGRGISLVGDTIHFPAGPDDFVVINDSPSSFHADLSDGGDGFLRVKVQGRYRGVVISRAVEMYFEPVTVPTQIFDFGIVARGPIQLKGNPSIGGGSGTVAGDNNVLSLYQGSPALSMTGNPSIAGDVFMTDPHTTASVSGGASVGGSSISAVRSSHIHTGNPDPEPELPAVDTSIFLPYVKTTYKPGQSVYRNVRIPANTNPGFSSDVTIEGVMYVEYPNQISFSGRSSLRGTIVVQNGAPPGSGSIKFTGQFQASGMDSLPATPDFPEEERKLTGSVILAPGFSLDFAGGAGTAGGTLVADSFSYHGNSGGVVNGTLIALTNAPFQMSGNPSLSRIKPNGQIPAGLLFSKTFRPLHKTYSEIRPY